MCRRRSQLPTDGNSVAPRRRHSVARHSYATPGRPWVPLFSGCTSRDSHRVPVQRRKLETLAVQEPKSVAFVACNLDGSILGFISDSSPLQIASQFNSTRLTEVPSEPLPTCDILSLSKTPQFVKAAVRTGTRCWSVNPHLKAGSLIRRRCAQARQPSDCWRTRPNHYCWSDIAPAVQISS